MTMEEIALTVGFSNRQSFYAAFYKRLGITPREYRQKNMAQIETQLNDRRKRLKESRAKKKQDN